MSSPGTASHHQQRLLADPALLAIDTSTRNIGLAIYDGVQVLAELCWSSLDYHTVELAPAISDLLDKARVKASEISVVAAALGPGSFTGLRIGLALAKGLALAQNIPLVGIPTLDILAAGQPPRPLPMAAVLQAGRGRLAVGWYQLVEETWRPDAQIEILTPQELYERIQTSTLVCGELTAEERRLFSRKRKMVNLASPPFCLRRPSILAELAWERWQAGQVADPASLSPIYLHYKDPIPG